MTLTRRPQRRAKPAQLILAAALLLIFVTLDAPLPWSTPLYYELSFDVEPWHGPDGIERARADLSREGINPTSPEITWTIRQLSCMGTGCNISKALRATFTWPDVPAALDRCFSYNPARLSLTTAYNRTDCRPIFTREQPPHSQGSEVPGSCSKATAARLVGDFFAKWNDHDVDGVVGLFSASVSFHDNVGGKQAMLTGREALRRYLGERFLLDDRFSNVVTQIPEIPSPARANPTVSFARSVGATTYRGNAKLVCVDDLLRDVVMSAE
jgi:hypothetical protein